VLSITGVDATLIVCDDEIGLAVAWHAVNIDNKQISRGVIIAIDQPLIVAANSRGYASLSFPDISPILQIKVVHYLIFPSGDEKLAEKRGGRSLPPRDSKVSSS
jgi:hypothetical protein